MPHACLTDRRVANLPAPPKGQVTHWDTLKGFGCRVSYGGSKTFVVMHGPRGRRRRTTIGTYPRVSLSEARSTARQILAQITLGQHRPRSTTTFDVALEKYLTEKATDSRKTTTHERERVLRRHFSPVLGWKSLSDITPLDIAEIFWEKSSLVRSRFLPPRDGSLSSISPFTRRKRLYACRRKIKPITGRKYSLLAKFEFARSVSALDHKRFSISPM